jgi:hypothetical protein
MLLLLLCAMMAVQVKDTATRMLTNFSVQAGTNDFYTAQRLFKDPGVKALPQVCACSRLDPRTPAHLPACVSRQLPSCRQQDTTCLLHHTLPAALLR